jgi:hypothetical protein
VTTPPDHPARILEHAFWRAVEEIGQCIELLGTIRDWRIAIVAGDDSMFDGPWLHQAVTRIEHEFRQWRTRAERSDDELQLANQVGAELRALSRYHLHLVGDPSWFTKRHELRCRPHAEGQEAAQPTITP